MVSQQQTEASNMQVSETCGKRFRIVVHVHVSCAVEMCANVRSSSVASPDDVNRKEVDMHRRHLTRCTPKGRIPRSAADQPCFEPLLKAFARRGCAVLSLAITTSAAPACSATLWRSERFDISSTHTDNMGEIRQTTVSEVFPVTVTTHHHGALA